MSAGEDGGVRVHFVPCPGQLVTRVAMLAGTGSGFATETGNDRPGDDQEDDEVVVWSAAAPGGSSETEFELGVTPPGFQEEVPLQEPVSSYGGIGAFVGFGSEGTLASVEIGFDVDDLPTGAILTLGGEVDADTFRREGLAACDR